MEHEDYVSFEQAKALKELGFDWEVFFQFNYKTKEIEPNEGNSYSEGGPFDTYDVLIDVTKCGSIPAPTLSQAQKWLREVKGIALNIIAHDGGGYHWESIFLPEGPEYEDFIGPDNRLFPTYEQALSAGINEALEFLNEENK